METIKNITLENLTQHYENVSFDTVKTIDYAIGLKMQKLKTSKPFLKSNANSDEALEYVQKLKQYEIDVVDINNQNRLISEYNNNLDNTIIEFIKIQAGLYDIPLQYQETTFKYIQDESNSFVDLYYKLCEIICSIF